MPMFFVDSVMVCLLPEINLVGKFTVQSKGGKESSMDATPPPHAGSHWHRQDYAGMATAWETRPVVKLSI